MYASSLRSVVISTSGFDDHRFEFCSRPTSGNVDSVIEKSGLVENVGGSTTVEIASLFQAVQKLLLLLFLRPPSWISGRRRRRIFSMVALKSPYPKMGEAVDTGLVSLACRWAKVEGVQICTSPLFTVQKGPAVRG